MFRLKSFSEKINPIEESLTKPQVKEVFSNDDFKVGLEFEFYDESFLEYLNKPKKDYVYLIIRFSNLLTQTQVENKRIVILKYAKTKNKDIPLDTDEHVIEKFKKEEQEKIYFYFHQQGIKRKELDDLMYYYLFAFIQKNQNLKQVEYFKGTQYYRKSILEKFTPETPKVKKFISLLENIDTEPSFENLRKFYKQNENLPKCMGSPIISKSESSMSSRNWLIKKELSVHPVFGGVEFISPPMKVSEVITATKEVFNYIEKFGNTDTDQESEQCGLHINISLPQDKMKTFDPVKFVLFSNESQVENTKLFQDRIKASYIGGVLKQFKQRFLGKGNNTPEYEREEIRKKEFEKAIKNSLESTKFEMKIMLMTRMGLSAAGKHSNINLGNVRGPFDRPKRSYNWLKKNERVEVRFFGGENYHLKFDIFKRVFSELLYAFDVACDEKKEKQKYMKKMFRIANLIFGTKNK